MPYGYKVVDLHIVVKAYLTAKYKVGLFIFACYSYQYRQAMRLETFRKELINLILRMYPSAPPPLFYESGGCPPCNTVILLLYYHYISALATSIWALYM